MNEWLNEFPDGLFLLTLTADLALDLASIDRWVLGFSWDAVPICDKEIKTSSDLENTWYFSPFVSQYYFSL